MKINIVHRTTYHYDEPAYDSVNEARLTPIADAFQQVLSFSLEVTPPASSMTYRDLHHNEVHVLEVSAPHQRLDVVATSEIDTIPDLRSLPTGPVPLTAVEAAIPPDDAFEFTCGTHFVPIDAAFWRHAIDVYELPEDTWAGSVSVMNWIYQQFQYTPGSTSVQSTALDVLASRQGVCQDFAHVMLAILRSRSVPARYVSGYFWAESLEEAESAAATHAWVEVFVPQLGWIGLDPTHDRRADDRYVRIAVGRDYADIRPLSGSYRGGATRQMEVDVRIERPDRERQSFVPNASL